MRLHPGWGDAEEEIEQQTDQSGGRGRDWSVGPAVARTSEMGRKLGRAWACPGAGVVPGTREPQEQLAHRPTVSIGLE